MKTGKVRSAQIQRKNNYQIALSKVARARRILGTRSETETVHRALNLVADEAALVETLHAFVLKGQGHIEDIEVTR